MQHSEADIFNEFFTRAKQQNKPLPDWSKVKAVWAHPDGRYLAATGNGQHVVPAVPNWFVRDYCPLDEVVDIYVPPTGQCKDNPIYRRKSFEPKRF
jgi:hypothetical protein